MKVHHAESALVSVHVDDVASVPSPTHVAPTVGYHAPDLSGVATRTPSPTHDAVRTLLDLRPVQHGAFVFAAGEPTPAPQRDRTRALALLDECERLGRGMVPDMALDQWLALERARFGAVEELTTDELFALPLPGLADALAPTLKWMAAKLGEEHASKKGTPRLIKRCEELAAKPALSMTAFNVTVKAFLATVDTSHHHRYHLSLLRQAYDGIAYDEKLAISLADGDGRGTASPDDPAFVGDEALLPFVVLRAMRAMAIGVVSQPSIADRTMRDQIGFALHDTGHASSWALADIALGRKSTGQRLDDLAAAQHRLQASRFAFEAITRAKAGVTPRIAQAINAYAFFIVHERSRPFELEYLILDDAKVAEWHGATGVFLQEHPYTLAEFIAARDAIRAAAPPEHSAAIPAPRATPSVPALNTAFLAQALATTIDIEHLSSDARNQLLDDASLSEATLIALVRHPSRAVASKLSWRADAFPRSVHEASALYRLEHTPVSQREARTAIYKEYLDLPGVPLDKVLPLAIAELGEANAPKPSTRPYEPRVHAPSAIPPAFLASLSTNSDLRGAVREAIADPATPLEALVERYGVLARMVARGVTEPIVEATLVRLVDAIKRRVPTAPSL